MPISATVTFQEDLTDVSVYDDVFGGYCVDILGKEIFNLDVKQNQKLVFLAQPDDDAPDRAARVTLRGKQPKVDYVESFELEKSGEPIFFPEPHTPKTIDVVTQISDFEEFSRLVLSKAK